MMTKIIHTRFYDYFFKKSISSKLDKSTILIFIITFFTLFPIIKPSGRLSHNEEAYFAFAHKFSEKGRYTDENSSLFFEIDRFKAIYYYITGNIIEHVGYESTQIIGRTFIVFLHSIILSIFLSFLGLNFLAVFPIFIIFIFYFEQNLFADFHLFTAFGSDEFALALLFISLKSLFKKSYSKAVILNAMSIYFHIIVGFWSSFLALSYILLESGFRDFLRKTMLLIIILFPLILYALIPYYTDGFSRTSEIENVNKVFAERNAHHVLPFTDFGVMKQKWKNGLLILVLLSIINYFALGYNVLKSDSLKKLQSYCLIISIQQLFSFIASYFDNSYVFAKLYLFKLNSLFLFLSIVLIFSIIQSLLKKVKYQNYFFIGLCIYTLYKLDIYSWGYRYKSIFIEDTSKIKVDKDELYSYVKNNTKPNGVFLIEKGALLDFERKTGQLSFARWKFTPVYPSEIIQWYDKMIYKQNLFDGEKSSEFDFDYVITYSENKNISEICNEVVFKNENYLLYACK